VTATAELVGRLRGVADAIPDDIGVWRLLRAAGRSDRAKAVALMAMFEAIETEVRRAATTIETLAAALAEAERERDALLGSIRVCATSSADVCTLNALTAAEARATAAEAERDRLIAALTPSADTKAAYIGEVKERIIRYDEFGDEEAVDHTISWDSTKATMAMILAQALSRDGGGE